MLRYLRYVLLLLLPIPVSAQLTWTRCSEGLNGDTVLSLTHSNGYIYAGMMTTGIYRSSDNGASWHAASAVDEFNRTQTWTMASLDTFIYAGQRGRGVYRSSIHSSVWTQMLTGMTNKIVMDLHVSGGGVFAATYGGGVFHSTDYGQSWMPFNENNGLDDKRVYAITSNPTAFFCGTAGVNTSADTGVAFKMGVFSTSWEKINSGFVPNGAHLDGVFNMAANDSLIFAGTDDVGLYRSTDMGSHWIRVDSNHGDVHSLRVAGNSVYYGTSYGGIYTSTDNGLNWQANNNGLSFGPTSIPYLVKDLLLVGDTMFAATDIGIFKQGIPKTSTSVIQHTKDAGIIVYPNPFSTKATISIAHSEGQMITLTLVDIFGNTIKKIIDNQMSSGDELFEVDDSLPNGTYFLIYQTADERKVIPIYHIQE